MLNPSPRSAADLMPLSVKGLTYIVGGKARLADVDLEIAGKGITVIMGPNGAGKSLLIRLLHGLIAPDVGEILWNGQPLGAAVRKRQAMVFQKPVLLRRSVEANIEFVLRLHPGRGAKSAEIMLQQAGLASRAKQPARSLSGGEQQRLALVRALAVEPGVLFLDEPTASLDPASVLQIEAMIETASRAGIKIIQVTHDVAQARRLADDVIFLQNGRVIEQSAASSFFHQPKADQAKAFLEGRLII